MPAPEPVQIDASKVIAKLQGTVANLATEHAVMSVRAEEAEAKVVELLAQIETMGRALGEAQRQLVAFTPLGGGELVVGS